MTYVSHLTLDGVEFKLHPTAGEAVAHLLDRLGPDYTAGPEARFWPSPDGRDLIQSDRAFLDFTARIYPSVEIATAAQMDLDSDALAHSLRLIADAIDAHQ